MASPSVKMNEKRRKRLAGSARAQLEASFDWQDGRVFLASDAVTVETGWPLRFEAERLSVSGTHGAEWRYPTSLQGSYGEVLTLRVGTLLDGQVRLAPEPASVMLLSGMMV